MTSLERAVGDYLDHLVVERGLSRNTVAAYRRDLAALAGWLAAQCVLLAAREPLPAPVPRPG